MKKILILLFFFSTQIIAQNTDRKLNRFVKEKNVERIIKTLSADDMLGRDSKKPNEIAKASAFIEGKFAKIGLQKLNGLNNFRQEFNVTKIEAGSSEIVIDGNKVANNEVLIMSEADKLSFSNNIPIVKIEKAEGFWQRFQQLNRDSLSNVVMVDSFHLNSLRQALQYYGGSRILNKRKTKPTNDIYVIGNKSPSSVFINATQIVSNLPMNNVVGVLEGKNKKDEIVIFSGHYDHLGAIEAVNGDVIANGADDDASGTTAVIALAKYFKKLRNNERTLVFVAFTAEEIGGYGSRFFSENMNPDQVMAMINIEMIGKPSKWGKNSAFMTGIEKSSLGEIMQKNLVGTPFAINKDPYPEQDLFYRSDNATLARLGVPAHSFSTDQIDSDKLYHSVDDEFESMDISNIVATIKALAISTKSVISGVDTPSRVDKTILR